MVVQLLLSFIANLVLEWFSTGIYFTYLLGPLHAHKAVAHKAVFIKLEYNE